MKLRTIRIILSGIIFAAFLSGYFFNVELCSISTYLIAKLQFFPTFIQIYNKATISIIFVILVIGTVLLGRIYCSLLCPLGTLQDCLISFSWKKKRHKAAASLIIRYTIPLLTILFFLLGVSLLLELTEPYSIISRTLNCLTSESIYKLDKGSLILAATIFISLFIIILMSIFRGRLYCNTICPTGAILSLLSFFPVFSIRLDKNKCTSCGKCENICKAECIDAKNRKLDTSKCISCFDCINVCKTKAIYYGRNRRKTGNNNTTEKKYQNQNNARREFIALFGMGLLTYPLKRLLPIKTTHIVTPVTPPGSIGVKHFLDNCTSCHLCIDKCPTKVLKPSVFENGLLDFMKPYLNFKYGACDYNCNICTQICPTKAIKSISLQEKQKISIGLAYLNKDICIPYAKGTACAACDEMCPTGATYMIKLEKGLPAPVINENLCIGCGACQKACPVSPNKAINVTGRKVHTKIEYKSLLEKSTSDSDQDFAF